MEFEKEMPENNTFDFNINESKHREIFRIEPSGEIYINGELLGSDTDVVKALRQVLEPEISKNKIYDEMLEMLHKCLSTISRFQNSMMAHPDHTYGSEFDDFTSLAQEIIEETELLIKKATT